MVSVSIVLCLTSLPLATAYVTGFQTASQVSRSSFAGHLRPPCIAPPRSAPCMAADQLVSALSKNGFVSAKAMIGTELVKEASERQGLSALASAALGRAMICSLLLADGLKDDERFQVKFNGDGPLRGVLATANGQLQTRGHVGNPKVNLPLNEKGKLDVGGGVGSGALFVVRTKQLPGEEIPSNYNSITKIVSGEVAEDINTFLAESEQKEGALAAGVSVEGQDEQVRAAGGWHVHLLPGATDEDRMKLVENLQQMQLSPTQMVRKGMQPKDILEMIMDGMEPDFFEPKQPCFHCPCSNERVFRTLRLLPRTEVDDIIVNNEVIEVKCEFCGKYYRLTPDEIKEELAKDAAEAAIAE